MFEKERVFTLEKGSTHICAEPVADRIADYRTDNDDEYKRAEGEKSASGEKSCGKEKRIAGEENADEKSAFGEYEYCDAEIATGLDDGNRVEIYTRIKKVEHAS